MVCKKEGGLVNYRRLNNVTIHDWYPLPNIADSTSRISGFTVFSKLDLQEGYYQVSMASEEDSYCHPIRIFEFLRMPFGLRNAGNTFQRMMDLVLGELPFCFVNLNDILIFSKDLFSHMDNLQEVFCLCRKNGLSIGLPNASLQFPRLSFLIIYWLPLDIHFC